MVPAGSSCMLVARWRPPASSGGGTATNVTSAPSAMAVFGKRASLKWKNSRASRLAHLRAFDRYKGSQFRLLEQGHAANAIETTVPGNIH